MSKTVNKKIKIVILGDPNVGKTTFITRYYIYNLSLMNSEKIKVKNKGQCNIELT
jgi:GTPase SAR1 family protein